MRKFYKICLTMMCTLLVIPNTNIKAEESCIWKTENGINYWYENGIKQGTYNDKNGVIGDGTIRGREIYDPESNGWYWLDACFDGAKAVNKEVWMPYIYQNENNWSNEEIEANASNSGNMASQVAQAINDKSGKWVRYDNEGKMVKGWYTVEGEDANIYPSQAGNTYYYDETTGLMAKGAIVIDNETYEFNSLTGALEKGEKPIKKVPVTTTETSNSTNVEPNGHFETVVITPATTETYTTTEKIWIPASTQKVLVKDAWTETVVVKDAWTETIPAETTVINHPAEYKDEWKVITKTIEIYHPAQEEVLGTRRIQIGSHFEGSVSVPDYIYETYVVQEAKEAWTEYKEVEDMQKVSVKVRDAWSETVEVTKAQIIYHEAETKVINHPAEYKDEVTPGHYEDKVVTKERTVPAVTKQVWVED